MSQKNTPSASLVSKQGMGGLNGGDGYRYQDAYAIAMAPQWLSEPAFHGMMVEAGGDIDRRFSDQGRVWHTYTQVKDHFVTPVIFRQIIKEFRTKDSRSKEMYEAYCIVAKGFGGKAKSLVKAIGRVRNSTPFFAGKGKIAIDDTHNDIQQTARQLRLTSEDIGFVLRKVIFEPELPGLDNADVLESLFVGQLVKRYDAPRQALQDAYQAMYVLVRNSPGTQLTRGMLQNALDGAVSRERITPPAVVIQEQTAVDVMKAVKRGTTAEVLEAFGDAHDALDSHPHWKFGVELTPDGERVLHIAPRRPESIQECPFVVRFDSGEQMRFLSSRDLLRHVYATGEPVSINVTNVIGTLGDHRLFAHAEGELTVLLPAEQIRTVPAKLIIEPVGLSYDYIVLCSRTFEGNLFADNNNQERAPIRINLAITPNPQAHTGSGRITVCLTDAAKVNAQHCLKYFKATKELATAGGYLRIVMLETDESMDFKGAVFEITDESMRTLDLTIAFFDEVVELEQRLEVKFRLPDIIRQSDAELVHRLHGLFVKGTVERKLPGIATIKAPMNAIDSQHLANLLESESGLFQMRCSVPPETVNLFDEEIPIPELRVTISQMRIDNLEERRRAWRKNRRKTHLKFVSTDSAVLTEQPINRSISVKRCTPAPGLT